MGLLLVIARVTHWLLYALLLVTVALGMAYVWVRGDSIFNWFRCRSCSIRAIGRWCIRSADWHALAANAVLIVAGLHSRGRTVPPLRAARRDAAPHAAVAR